MIWNQNTIKNKNPLLAQQIITGLQIRTCIHMPKICVKYFSRSLKKNLLPEKSETNNYSRVRNKRTPLNKHSPWNIWQKQ